MILSKLGQMESAEATKSLTSAMLGYKLQISDVMGIVDKFSAVDMKSAVDAQYLAISLSEVATSANLAGISMDKAVGYIAAIGSTTQDSAEAVGKKVA